MNQKVAVCAVIPMGGSGKRMLPLSAAISKYLLPVGDFPVVFHAVHELRNAGVNRIC
ncbi:sugar phosphate nucleotidyltransferase [Agrobacterium tumefaciens]|uniref:sugar phosphate nucleotidyltransferase n=1 Tax=Agrobacterium tumefaciens TaxID=358 RepID=UPI003D9C0258